MFIRKEGILEEKYSKITHLGGTLSSPSSSKVFQPIRIEIDNSNLPAMGGVSKVSNTAIIILHELKNSLDPVLDVIKVLHEAELTSAINFISLNNDKLCVGVIHELWELDTFKWYLKKINNVLQRAQLQGVINTMIHGTNKAAYEGMNGRTSELFIQWISPDPLIFLEEFQDKEGLIYSAEHFDEEDHGIFSTLATMHG